MNDYELRQAKKEFYERMRQEGKDWKDIIETKEEKKFRCIEMINSILAYHYHDNAIYVLSREYTKRHNYLEEYVDKLGEKKVLELIQNQIDDIERIEENVYTDCDGCSYNSIVWKH